MTEQNTNEAAESPEAPTPIFPETEAMEDAASDAAPVEAKTPKSGGKHRWYIVHTHTNFEKKVKQQILEKAAQYNLTDQISEVVVPTEEVVEVRRGKKATAERKFFPGYVLVKMELTDAAWHLVKNVEKVTGFLGGGNRPQPVPQREVDAIFSQIQEGVGHAKHSVIYEVGDTVKITDGPFDSFTGVVEEVDHDREKVKVSVSIFGRATPVELDYTQVNKS
jgi:transcription termination/antitermination protein NusG